MVIMQQIKMCDIPISPEDTMRICARHDMNPDQFRDEHLVCPAGHVSLDSSLFVMLLETMRSITEAADWSKPARIVLEYDPRDVKMHIVTFTESA